MNTRYKLVILGDSGVGKTSILRRWLTNSFSENQSSTVGSAFYKTTFNFRGDEKIVHVWDTAGQEKYQSLTPIQIQGAFAAMIVFDITSKDTFLHLDEWLKQIENSIHYLIICGNKADERDSVVITDEEAIEYASKKKLKYFKISAKTGFGIKEAFESLLVDAFSIYN